MCKSSLPGHADADHHIFGRLVMNGGEGIDVGHTPFLESGFQTGGCALCRQALSPEGSSKPPAYFDAGGGPMMSRWSWMTNRFDGKIKTRLGKTDKADEFARRL